MIPREARITINAVELTDAQSMCVRVAVTVFVGDLSKLKLDPDGRVFDGYTARLNEVLKMLLDTPQC